MHILMAGSGRVVLRNTCKAQQRKERRVSDGGASRSKTVADPTSKRFERRHVACTARASHRHKNTRQPPATLVRASITRYCTGQGMANLESRRTHILVTWRWHPMAQTAR